MNPLAPMLYGLPTLHKDNVPIGPVVYFINAPKYKLYTKLNQMLPKFMNLNFEYAVKNSFELINKIKC